MPAPHWLAAVPGSAHVDVPLGTTVQPWSFSSEIAFDGLYGYGLFFTSDGDEVVLRLARHRTVGADAVALVDLLVVQRLVDQDWMAWRKYSWLKILPAAPPSPVEVKLYGK